MLVEHVTLELATGQLDALQATLAHREKQRKHEGKRGYKCQRDIGPQKAHLEATALNDDHAHAGDSANQQVERINPVDVAGEPIGQVILFAEHSQKVEVPRGAKADN